jgi:hypothetical protein
MVAWQQRMGGLNNRTGSAFYWDSQVFRRRKQIRRTLRPGRTQKEEGAPRQQYRTLNKFTSGLKKLPVLRCSQ